MIISKNKQCLVKAKELLVSLYDKDLEFLDEQDASQIFYVIQLLDYLILDTIKLNSLTLQYIMEEIINTSIYSNKPRLLQVLTLLKQLEGDVEDDNICA